jgi:lysyl-tRNA synthetase class 2
MLRDDISTDEEKTMYNVIFKVLRILAICGVRGTVSERRWVKSVHIYGLTVLAKTEQLFVKGSRC